MRLVIVESPTKSRTIQRILGEGYEVQASMGHVRDLPLRKFGIDIDNDFEPEYKLLSRRKGIVRKLRELSREASEVFLATDPDREGEAISWHLAEALKLPGDKVRRVTFHEITPAAIRRAFEAPGGISMPLVHAQQARRLLDRIVGYKLSPLLWKKIARRLSAGRVQSVALKFVVDREREIAAFKPEEYWTLTARLAVSGGKFEARLTAPKPTTREEVDALLRELRSAEFRVDGIERTEVVDRPRPPFTTSLLQQRASAELRFPARKTMRVAQKLYESGRITYIRTDSFRVAEPALHAARRHIGEEYGAEYVPERPNRYKSKDGAHEAIRPTRVERLPDRKGDAGRLYRLIWKRFVASQMKPAVIENTEVKISAGSCAFEARGRRVLFDGHLKVSGRPKDERLPPLKKGETPKLVDLKSKQNFTEPPSRYSEATLIRALEKNGIGRPSTYAPTVGTLMERGYVETRTRRLFPTPLGELVTGKLEKHFVRILDKGFTADLEEKLDGVESGKIRWAELLRGFYEVFIPEIQRAEREMEPESAQPSGQACPMCGAEMSRLWTHFGARIECECGVKRPPDATEVPGEPCATCGRTMWIRSGPTGRFLACAGYPVCKTTMSLLRGNRVVRAPETECGKCGRAMVVRGSRRGPFLGCSGYPECRNLRKIPRDWIVPLFPEKR